MAQKKALEVRAKKQPKGPSRTRRWHPDARPWREKMAEGVLGNVEDVARLLNVSPTLVYSRWRELGGIKLGRHLRFDLCRIHEQLGRLRDRQGGEGEPVDKAEE